MHEAVTRLMIVLFAALLPVATFAQTQDQSHSG